jgi:hypothetical protein
MKAQTALKCIHCNKKCTSKQQLTITTTKLVLEFLTSMASGGDAAGRESRKAQLVGGL